MERYAIAPALIETFVETPRFIGAAYKASGWTHVGFTQGRGRYDRHKKIRQAHQGHLAETPAQGLETSLEPLTRWNATTTLPRPRTPLDGQKSQPPSRHPPRTERLPVGNHVRICRFCLERAVKKT